MLTPEQIATHQLEQLRRMLPQIAANNAFYGAKIREAGLADGPASLEEFFAKMPLTAKSELIEDQIAHPIYGSNLTQPMSDYTRLHRTSSTSGKPLRWIDTAESWAWMVGAWAEIMTAAGVHRDDRVLIAFSFGPHIGLWLAFEAAQQIGCLTIPGGAMNSEARLDAIMVNDVTVLCCTPTYALRLGEVAGQRGLDLGDSKVRAIIVGGEPGASIPTTRALIKQSWPGAQLFDHHGMTEAGPVTFQCGEADDILHTLESHFICEVVDRETSKPLPRDSEEIGELVLTNLGRIASPAIRYRTGDLVRSRHGTTCACGRRGLSFVGGIIGRVDDMVVVRGVNLFPSAIDQIVRGCIGIAEYRVEIRDSMGMAEVEIKIEAKGTANPLNLCTELEAGLRAAFNLRIKVTAVPTDSLPRFELKAKRWVKM